jgi:hypothetical protein
MLFRKAIALALQGMRCLKGRPATENAAIVRLAS